jgi:undecaprenyl diphosphate synthase
MTDTIVPRHIGFIIDGNRRWAKQHGIPAYEGHLAGYNTLKEIAFEVLEAGVEFMSVYAFSTENHKRSKDEVSKLMALSMGAFKSDLHIFHEKNVRLIVLGSPEGMSKTILKAIDEAQIATKNNTAGTLLLCFNYGGQLEITEAVKKIVQSGANVDDITPELIANNLYTPDIPPVDLIVRSGGEQRLSNFMLWRAAYSELLFVKKFWPDMTKSDVKDILEEYSKRHRRFGG